MKTKMSNRLIIQSVVALLLLFQNVASATNYETISNGEWSNGAIWKNNLKPPLSGTIVSGDTVFILHDVLYNRTSDLNIYGAMVIRSVAPDTAILTLYGQVDVTIKQGGILLIDHGIFWQCEKDNCARCGQYGNGDLENLGRIIMNTGFIRVADDFNTEANGTSYLSDGCLVIGGDLIISSDNSRDSLIRMNISLGWRGDGSFLMERGVVYFESSSVELAGNGDFYLMQGIASGSLSYVSTLNHLTQRKSSGSFILGYSLNTSSGLSLFKYCLKYVYSFKPNNKLSNNPQSDCSVNGDYFPGDCENINNAVPVSWLFFRVIPLTSQQILCQWATTLEINSSHFLILRSSDGREFITVGEVTAAGNSSETLMYEFIDTLKENGLYYYKIRQVDADNQFSETEVKVIDLNNINRINPVAFPNPVSEGKIQIASGTEMIEKIRITDMRGVVVFSKVYDSYRGFIEIDVLDWESGLYHLTISTKTDILSLKILK